MRRANAIGIAVAFVLLGSGLGWWGSVASAKVAAPPQPEPEATARLIAPDAGALAADIRQREEPPAREVASVSGTTAWLVVRLEDAAGAPVAGSVGVAAGPAAAGLPVLGGTPVWQRHLPGGGADIEEHDAPSGTVAIEVPAGQVLWIRAAPAARPMAPVYRRVDGIAGEHELRVLLKEGHTCQHIHVIVYGPDFEGPQPGVEVEVRGWNTASAWRGRTDASGYVLAVAPDAGIATVQVVGAPEVDADARTTVHIDGEQGEPVVVLVAPEPHVRCSVVLVSEIEAAPGSLPPALILCRMDGGRECVRLLAPAVAMGRSEVSVELPPGTFAVMALPQGCAEIRGGTGLFEVGEAAPAITVHLGKAVPRTLELADIPDSYLPVQVRWLAPEDVFDTAEERIWLGPVRWHRRREQVHEWPRPGRLLARGRGSSWISAIVAPFTEGPVAMLPALEVEVLAPIERGRHGGLVAEIATAGSVLGRVLRGTLVATQQGRRPFLRTVLQAPAGPVTVVVRRADGTEIWREGRDGRGRVRLEVP